MAEFADATHGDQIPPFVQLWRRLLNVVIPGAEQRSRFVQWHGVGQGCHDIGWGHHVSAHPPSTVTPETFASRQS